MLHSAWLIPPWKLRHKAVWRVQALKKNYSWETPGPVLQPLEIYIIQDNSGDFSVWMCRIKSANTSGSLALQVERITIEKAEKITIKKAEKITIKRQFSGALSWVVTCTLITWLDWITWSDAGALY